MSKFYTSAIVAGNDILVREISDDGSTANFKYRFKPKLYIPADGSPSTPPFKSIDNIPLTLKQFDSMYDAREFAKTYANIDGFKVFGINKYDIQYIADTYKNVSPDTSKIEVAYIDIEVFSEDGSFPKPEDALHPVNAITWYNSISEKYNTYVLETRETTRWDANTSIHSFASDVNIKFFCSEAELLTAFVNDWSYNHPHVVTGWHSEGFDIPYLINRITSICSYATAKRLSPWGILKTRNSRDKFGNIVIKHNILGISQLDYKELYQKHTFENQEFYTLDHISYVELKEKKLNYSEVAGLHELWKVNTQKFIDYNIKDVELIVKLNNKLQLFNIVYDIAYFSLINYEDTFSPVKTWDAIIYSHLLKSNTIVPYETHSTKTESYEGAYVKSPKPGLYGWIASFDLASLYPSIIRQWNIGPETIINSSNYGNYVAPLLERKINLTTNNSYAANGVEFSNDKQSFMSELMEWLYNERVDAKRKAFKFGQENNAKQQKIFNTRQLVLKILLNSMYGACGSVYFRFFNIQVATAITLSGQLAIKWVSNALNKYFNNIMATKNTDYITYIDTDSCYLNLETFVKKFMPLETCPHKITDFLDSAMKHVEKTCITPAYEDLKKYLNCREQLMIMDRECIGNSALWTAKKRYAINVYDTEGDRHDKPKLKIMGLETIKKDYPEICRSALKKSLEIILQEQNNNNLILFIDAFRKIYFAANYRDIAQTKSVSFVDKYSDAKTIFKKGTPFNSKAAILYNKFSKHDKIKNGNKIKIIFLKEPNPIKSPLIGFVNSLPVNGLEPYIDKDLMFLKHFIKPLTAIAEAIGWKLEESADLCDFF